MREAIHDNAGFVVGYLEPAFSGEVRVYDGNGMYVGYARQGFDGGTYDSNGYKVSPDFVPIWLLG